MSSRLCWLWVLGGTLYSMVLGCAPAALTPPVQRVESATRVAPALVVIQSEQIPVYSEDLSVGELAAPVTLVAFIDLECPYCARAWETLERLQARFGTAQLRIVVKHLPLAFHQSANALAQRTVEIQRRSGDAQAIVFLKQALAGNTEFSTDVVQPREASLSVEQQLDRDRRLAAQLGIDGTPTFRINGIPLVGALPDSEFERAIQSELRTATELVQQGVSAGEVYARRVSANYHPSTPNDQALPQPDETRWAIPVSNSPFMGAVDAPVTVVAFMDYECPFCQRGFETMKQLVDKYPKRVRVVFKHRPLEFHEHAVQASQFALAVRKLQGDDAFWRVTEQLFAHRSSLSSETLATIASSLGLEPGVVSRNALDRGAVEALESDVDAADDFGVEGTPQFFVNGLRVRGAKPLDEFSALVERELAQAAELRANGTPEAQLNAALTAQAQPAPEPRSVDANIVLPSGPRLGQPNAPVTIHVFSDYQCPFCQRGEATVRELLAKYPRQTSLVWHDFPLDFHERARAAATLAREVRAQKGDAAFFQINRLIFEKQADLSEPALLSYARSLGVREEPLQAETRERAHGASIDRDLKLAESLHITGTPTFLVGQYLVEGAQPLDRFERLIRRELAKRSKSKQKIASGAAGLGK